MGIWVHIKYLIDTQRNVEMASSNMSDNKIPMTSIFEETKAKQF